MRLLKRVVTLVLLAGIAYLVATREGMQNVATHLESLSMHGALIAVALPLVAVAASVRRWQWLLRREQISLPYRVLLASFLRGRFVGAFTPSTTGLDLYRLVDVASRTGQRAASGRVILVEKLYGLVALALVTLALLPVGLARFFGTTGVLIAVGLGVGSMAGLVLLARPHWMQRSVGWLPSPISTRLEKIIGVVSTRPMDRVTMLRVLGLGLLSHTAAAGIFVGTGIALGVAASPFELLVVGNAIVLATLIPISVGGVGVREGTAIALLATLGIGPTEGALVGLLGYLAMQPPALVGGVLGLLARAPTATPSPAARVSATVASVPGTLSAAS